tara:strand:- start:637 stop:1074 length:438 start_codon:yes stop_codon:yes gene_type:complete
MLDRSLIKKRYPPISFDVEKQRLRFFAKATGQTDPIYFDEQAARENGHPSILAPPTFLTVVGHEQEKPYKYITDLGIDFGKILHAGQTYKYHKPVYAGDVITMESQIVDLYEKKNGTLQFIEFQSTYANQDNIMVAESLATLVAR